MKNSNKKEKIAWILAGGAARTVYSAGSLYALCKLKPIQPDIIIACSGSAATSLCYVTGQFETIKKVWCKDLSSKKFVNLWRFWKMVNIDYLIDVVLKENNPLDMGRVRASSIRIFFPVTNSISGKVEYLSNKSPVDIWEILRAAKSVPFFSNLLNPKGVLLQGTPYCDSIGSTRYQVHIDKALQEGATKILIFDSWHIGDHPNNYFFSKLYAYIRNKEFRINQLGYIKTTIQYNLPPLIDVCILSPKEKLDMSPWEIDQENANKVFMRGFNEVMENEDLRNKRFISV